MRRWNAREECSTWNILPIGEKAARRNSEDSERTEDPEETEFPRARAMAPQKAIMWVYLMVKARSVRRAPLTSRASLKTRKRSLSGR